MFLVAEYKSFIMNDEPGYDVFEFDDLCSTRDYLLNVASKSAAISISPPSLELKPLPSSLNYTFLRPDESLPVTISFDLNRD